MKDLTLNDLIVGLDNLTAFMIPALHKRADRIILEERD